MKKKKVKEIFKKIGLGLLCILTGGLLFREIFKRTDNRTSSNSSGDDSGNNGARVVRNRKDISRSRYIIDRAKRNNNRVRKIITEVRKRNNISKMGDDNKSDS